MLEDWLKTRILIAAQELEQTQSAVYQFEKKVADIFQKKPLQAWEADLWFRGVKLGLIKAEDYFFRAGAGKKGAMSLFVRNDQGRNVGLRREAITQVATYVSLVTDYGYKRPRIRFESQWMDVVVYGEDKSVFIYAENKAAENILTKLCGRLEADFEGGVPVVDLTPVEGKRLSHDDALMKANHIWRNRPYYFWAVCPTKSQAYTVHFNSVGFSLKPIERLPLAHETTRRPAMPF
jgi:hypothetical protein